MKRLFRRKHPNAGWECLVCGHQQHCPYKKTFWADVGATLYRHGQENHPEGMDYVAHIPKAWERPPHRHIYANQPANRKDTP